MSTRRIIQSLLSHRLSQAWSAVSLATLFMGLICFVREALVAKQFGTTRDLDMFVWVYTALTLPTFALSSGIQPELMRGLADTYLRDNIEGFSRTWSALAALSLCGVIAILGLTYAVVLITAPQVAVLQTLLWLSPLVPFGVVVAYGQAFLLSEKRFFAAYMLPTVTPLVVSSVLFTGTRTIGQLQVATCLAATVEAGAAMLLALSPYRSLVQRGLHRMKGASSRATFIDSGWLIVSGLLLSLTPVIDQWMAVQSGEGMASALNFGSKLPMFLYSCVGIALGNAIFPFLIESRVLGDWKRFSSALTQANLIGASTVVAGSFFIWICSDWLIELLFVRGRFNAASMRAVSDMQRALAWDGLPSVALTLMWRGATALGRTRFLAGISVLVLASKPPLNFVFLSLAGPTGIAFATGVMHLGAAVVVMIFVFKQLKRLSS